MPQLDPTSFISQLFWLTLTFILLYVLLARVVLPPLVAIMEQRDGKVKGDIARAEVLKAEAEHAREQYERTLADAHMRSQQVFADAALSIKQHTDSANADMERALAAKLSETQAAIAAKKQEVYTQLVSDSTELVSRIVEKFTHKRPDAAHVSEVLRSLKSS